jgi:hypothetical protein
MVAGGIMSRSARPVVRPGRSGWPWGLILCAWGLYAAVPALAATGVDQLPGTFLGRWEPDASSQGCIFDLGRSMVVRPDRIDFGLEEPSFVFKVIRREGDAVWLENTVYDGRAGTHQFWYLKGGGSPPTLVVAFGDKLNATSSQCSYVRMEKPKKERSGKPAAQVR